MSIANTSARTLTDLLFEDAVAGRCLVAPDGTVLRANTEWLRATGCTEEQVVGEDVVDLFPGTRDVALAMYARARAGHRVEIPRHARNVNGRETWSEGRIEPVPMDGGNGVLVTLREVGRSGAPPPEDEPGRPIARANDPERLRESEAWFRLLSETLPQIVCVAAPDGAIEYVNPAWILFSGKGLRESARAGWREVVHPDDFGSVRECLRRVLILRNPQEIEVRYRAADGSYRWFLSRLAPMVQEGRVIRLIGAAMDIEDRKRAEEALHEREAELRLAQGIAHVGSWSWRVGTPCLQASEEVFRIYGRELASGVPMNDSAELRRHYTPEGWKRRAEVFQKALSDGQPWERDEEIIRPDGSVRWVHFRGEVERDASGAPLKLRGTVEDITERRRMEDALSEREEWLRAAFSATPDAINVNRLRDGEYVSVNEGFARLSGWSAEEVLGRTTAELDVWADPLDRARLLERLSAGEPVQNAEIAFRRKDGTVFTAAISARTFTVRGERFLLATTRDVSDLKRAEEALRAVNEKLREADRRKDEFIGMLSHELRNPLAPIRNSTYILRRAEPGSEQVRHAQAVIERQAEHLTRLVDDLLDVTRIARGKIDLRRARIDIREVVRRAADDYQETMRERGIAFRAEVPDSEVCADADATRIAQVVGNLLHNAAKFTPRGGEVAVALGIVQGQVQITVRDTGAGIDPALLPRVFDPFVQGERTLSRAEGGLGLGLALVRGITELHGGTVRVESAGRGRGAAFVVRLPLLAPYAGGRVRERPPPSGTSRKRRVLVVDDNRDAAESLAQIVEMFGQVVEVVHDGAAAVERGRSFRPDVILCDIGLPGMSGYDVAIALREAGTEAQLIAVSGYAQPEDVKLAIEAGFDGHIAKPCDAKTIERLLG